VPRFDEQRLREVLAESRSWAEAVRLLGYRSAGGNWRTLQKYAQLWRISTEHFDPDAVRNEALRKGQRPLEEVMVRNSSYGRQHLKRRLLAAGIKERRCETCGQEEVWQGRRMALILDHINGIANDHRLENLRILCPNCAATLDTHCARNKQRAQLEPRACTHCGTRFQPQRSSQRYCSRRCGSRWDRRSQRGPRPSARKVVRPNHEQLRADVEELGWRGTGRKYGVSDTAIRKWIRDYERGWL
jgi:hypothetical protein